MVVTEALARGLPVVAAEVGGVPEALGHGAAASAPGLWCRPATLRRWPARCVAGWATPASRAAAAGWPSERRASLRDWSATAAAVADVVARVAAMTGAGIPVSADWLALREPADAAARARELVDELRPALSERRPAGDPRPRRAGRGRWAAGWRRSCRYGNGGCFTTGTPICCRWPARILQIAGRPRGDAAVGHHPAHARRPRRCGPDHGVGAARPDDRRPAAARWSSCARLRDVPCCGRCPSPASGAGAGGSAGRPGGDGVRRPPATDDGGRPPARPRRGRGSGGGVPAAGDAGARPSQPVAARPRRGGSGGGVVRRVGGGRLRAGRRTRAGRAPTSSGAWPRPGPAGWRSRSAITICSPCP